MAARSCKSAKAGTDAARRGLPDGGMQPRRLYQWTQRATCMPQPHVRLADRANVGSCAISAATTTLDGGEMPSYGREWRNIGCSACELKVRLRQGQGPPIPARPIAL